MSETIRIKDDTAYVINELGGTFDSPDDVIRQLIIEANHGTLLQEGNQEDTKPENLESNISKWADGVETGQKSYFQKSNDFSRPEEYTTEKYIVKIYDDDKLLEEFESQGHGGQSKVMYLITECLIKNHGLMDKISIPYISRGSKPLIDYSDDQFNTSKKLLNDLYLNTNYNSSQKKKRIVDLVLTECDLEVEFGGDW